jgi:hypothetical protein
MIHEAQDSQKCPTPRLQLQPRTLTWGLAPPNLTQLTLGSSKPGANPWLLLQTWCSAQLALTLIKSLASRLGSQPYPNWLQHWSQSWTLVQLHLSVTKSGTDFGFPTSKFCPDPPTRAGADFYLALFDLNLDSSSTQLWSVSALGHRFGWGLTSTLA